MTDLVIVTAGMVLSPARRQVPLTKLKLTSDRKVSPLSRYEKGAKRWKPKVANSFGLPAFLSCPEFTNWCKQVCYAANLERVFTSANRLVNHNLTLLKACGSNVKAMTTLLTELVGSVKWHGTARVFRWHWDGDLFSRPYTAAVASTCQAFPDIQFWLYTRSFDYVPLLVDIPNLTVYLSTDEYNIDKAKRTYAAHPTLRIAACANSWEQSEDIMRQVVGRSAPRCPALTGKTPMVNDEGVGACVACKLCIRGTNHVRFATH
jgi:protein gp88